MHTRVATRLASPPAPGSSAPSVASRATPANTVTSAQERRYVSRAVPRTIIDWTNRTLMDPGCQRQPISGSVRQDEVDPTASSPTSFEPSLEPPPRLFTTWIGDPNRLSRYARDAITSAVDYQKQYADQRGRKHLKKVAMGDRVLLSMAETRPLFSDESGQEQARVTINRRFKVSNV